MNKQGYTYDMYESCISIITEFGMPIIEMLDPKPGEKIVDVGCGTGVLTREIAEHGCEVIGLDKSPEMIVAATALGVDARLADGTEFSENMLFDAVISNAVLHWMEDKYMVIRNVWNHLKPGGRFVADCGADGCLRMVREGIKTALAKRGIDYKARTPWNFCEYAETMAILEAQGFKVEYISRIDKPVKLRTDLKSWLRVCAASYTEGLTEEEKEAVYNDVETYCKPMLYKNNNWYADYVRLRFKAVKPEEAKSAGSKAARRKNSERMM